MRTKRRIKNNKLKVRFHWHKFILRFKIGFGYYFLLEKIFTALGIINLLLLSLSSRLHNASCFLSALKQLMSSKILRFCHCLGRFEICNSNHSSCWFTFDRWQGSELIFSKMVKIIKYCFNFSLKMQRAPTVENLSVSVANRQAWYAYGAPRWRECPERWRSMVDALRWSRPGDSWQFQYVYLS